MGIERAITVGLLSGLVFWAGLPRACAQGADAAAEGGANLTAEELVNKANLSYSAGKFEEAENLFSSFLNNYGESAEAAMKLPDLLPLLAFSQLRLNKYEAASGTIGRALGEEVKLTGNTREELEFWHGVCKLHTEDFDTARAMLSDFTKKYPRSTKATEARILAATTYVIEEKWKEAAAALAALTRTVGESERSRVRLLHLYALHRAEDFEAARQLVIEEYPRLEQMIQIAAFQTITLELGNHFLENGEARKAMSCLQRVWPQERLVRHQQARLEKISAARVAAEKRNNAFEVFRLSQLAAKAERELKFFREIENFDAALRLRLATAYLTLQRYHEAALILQRMLEEMAPNKIVEEGSLRVVQCWTQVERWPAVVTNADQFLKRFPKSDQRPMALYLKGQAEQNNGDYKDAVATFDQLRLRHPAHELAPRASFMAGFSFLLAEDYATAAERFEKARKEHAKDEIAETAHFWLGRAKILNKQYDDGRTVLEEYLAKFKKNGVFIGEATFFKAFGAHAKKDYETGIRELRDFLKNFPGHEQSNEALVLLGDALCASGEIEEGIEAYKRIEADAPRFFEEAQFKIAKALRLSEHIAEMRAHLEQFISAHPGSARLPEAIYWIGWSWRQEGREDKAKELYWQTIAEMGGDPARRSMEDVFAGLLRLYKTEEERKELLARLGDLSETALDAGEKTLSCRTLWAQAQALKKRDPAQSRRLLEEAAKRVEVSSTNPMILADCAEALEAVGKAKEAEQMMRDLVKWNPRAPQKDRAFAMLGNLALEQGREAEALDWFRRFEKESAGSVLTADILAAKARLLEKRGQSAEAIATLEKLLADPYAPGQRKASALIDLGELLLKRGQTQKAFPYFQRVYVMYGRWPEHVATAYLKSGTILEKLNDPDGARRTYEEMLAREDLASTREAAVARERLAKLKKGEGT